MAEPASLPAVTIGRPIGPAHPPFVVAELSANHLGDLARAKAIIDAAATAGCDAIKLQSFTPATMTLDVIGPGFQIDGGPWAGRSLWELYDEAHTPWEWHAELFDHARARGLIAFSTPYVQQLKRLRAKVDVPIVASLNGTTPGGWTTYARKLEAAGASALELNLYEVATSPLESGATVEDRQLAVVAAVVAEVDIPVTVKLSPFYASVPAFVRRLEHAGARGVRLETEAGACIRAERVVVAAGYASQRFLRRLVARNRSSYAFVTDPIPAPTLAFLANTMFWESARPYVYVRATGDGRLLVGGEDDAIDLPSRRDASVDAKAAKLARKVARLFPHVPVQPAFAWGGTFAETSDGLPWFGAHPETGARTLYAMAYGGNGITYSMLGAGLIRAAIERRRHPLSRLFGFGRRERSG